eukprot:TRINITY_DN3469_c0_g1_i3.p1 TRINITY_DN3469_c0_g1~~TRINITY_DN3469_c0_g1_i3.p1  ORF type:complete len:288 (+),score=55.96 TRINITY_DN3469_c0_g1_i3:68-931(+)
MFTAARTLFSCTFANTLCRSVAASKSFSTKPTATAATNELKNKAVAVVSGGADSTVMLWHLQKNGYDVVEAMTFNYGQRHQKEIENAKLVVKEFNNNFGKNIGHNLVDVTNIGRLISSGALTGDAELPKSVYTVETQKVTVVPNRNMIFLSIAAGRAVTLEARYVAYAAHASDFAVYPDCRPDFISKLSSALESGNSWTPVSVVAPFQHKTKTEIVAEGIRLGAPLQLTWSCYDGKERPCLKCGTCLERTQAFHHSGAKDPVLTGEEWVVALEELEKRRKAQEKSSA